MYLLNYARTGDQFRRFCQACHEALRPGGRFIGVNDNVRNVPTGTVSFDLFAFGISHLKTNAVPDDLSFQVTLEGHLLNAVIWRDSSQFSLGSLLQNSPVGGIYCREGL